MPLVSVLRDTVGDQNTENDRVTYVWLLTFAWPHVGQRILSAIPFFYWRLGSGSASVSTHDIAPFMDLSAPENHMMARVERDRSKGQRSTRWESGTGFDTGVQRQQLKQYEAASRRDHQIRRQAPVSNGATGLTQMQLDAVVNGCRACGFLIREGPITAQDRWEEARGFSPSTLAVHIAALICGAEFFDDRGEHGTAEFIRDYADFLESHIERWTVNTQGTLVAGIRRHYIRVNPASSVDCADEDPNCGTLVLANQRPGAIYEFPAKEIVDEGFLELVRYGIRGANDPVIKDSLCVVDSVLKVETPYGPAWRRYNQI